MVHRRRSVSRHRFNHNSGDDGAHGGYGRYGKSFEFSFIIIIFNFNFRRQGYRIFAILTILTIACGQKTSKIKASGVWQKVWQNCWKCHNHGKIPWQNGGSPPVVEHSVWKMDPIRLKKYHTLNHFYHTCHTFTMRSFRPSRTP